MRDFLTGANGREEWHDELAPNSGSRYEPGFGLPGEGFFESIRNAWQVDELAAEIGLESQSRVALLGLDGAGKRLLYNRLQGWTIEWPDKPPVNAEGLIIERRGLFVLTDLPGDPESIVQCDELLAVPDHLLNSLGDPTVIVYLLDATRPISQADYRWIAAIRTSGIPFVVAINKIDLLEQQQIDQEEVERCLAMPAISISALTGENIEDKLLPAILQAAPKLTIALGREISSMRRQAAWQVIKRSALLAGLLGAQPVPGLELPFLAMLQIGTVLRIGAIYGFQPGGGTSREALVTAGIVVLFQYVSQSIVKLVPVLGSIVGGVISALMTLVLGALAMRYYESGASLPLTTLGDRFSRRFRTIRFRKKQPQEHESDGAESGVRLGVNGDNANVQERQALDSS